MSGSVTTHMHATAPVGERLGTRRALAALHCMSGSAVAAVSADVVTDTDRQRSLQ
jgi:hypothetical protein